MEIGFSGDGGARVGLWQQSIEKDQTNSFLKDLARPFLIEIKTKSIFLN